ncbi:MAG TPA: DUF1080 domain-containing protein, partial [bacterium]|nr:DUF1080 domain-containing protein [bacterium]
MMNRSVFIPMILAISVFMISAQDRPEEYQYESGFTQIFNGTDLSGWEGDSRFWSVQNGAIRGQTTSEVTPEENTFLVWQGGTLSDFDLRLQFRISNGNSGVQYRSTDLGNYRVSGYQAE